GVVVMQVGDDDILDRVGVDADRLEAVTDRLDEVALAPRRHGGVEAGVDHIGSPRADDRPDVEIEGLEDVMGVAADEILRRPAVVVPVADRIDFVDVVAHGSPLASLLPRQLLLSSRTRTCTSRKPIRDPGYPGIGNVCCRCQIAAQGYPGPGARAARRSAGMTIERPCMSAGRAHLDAGAALDRLDDGGEVLVGADLVAGVL